MATMQSRQPIVVVDRIGYGFYRLADGTPFLSADEFEVRLVTRMDKLAEAIGEELSAVAAVPRGDHAAFREAARLLHGIGGHPAARIVAITERYLLPVAELREELNLPGMSVAQTLLFRDKVRMKTHLLQRGLRVPVFAPYSRETALQLLDRFGAIVVKPRLGASTVGVSVIRNADALHGHEMAHRGQEDEFEVEEFIDGTLYHIDCVVDRGRVIAATAGRSVDPTNNYVLTRPYRDVGVAAGHDLDALLAFNAAVAAAFPDFRGVFHHEVFATPQEIVFCEVGARAGGGGIIAGFAARTGQNLDNIVLKAQLLDRVPSEIAVHERLTGYVMLYSHAGRLVSMPPAPTEPWVIEAQILASPGDVRGPSADWSDAVVIVTVGGETESDVMNRLDTVIAAMTPQIVVARGEGSADTASRK